jgi:4-hydroxy-tetrahydrodipicolinate reductase
MLALPKMISRSESLPPVKISILGASGSVGSLVVKLTELSGHSICSRVSLGDSVASLFPEKPDVVIDFSSPIATESLLAYVKDNCIRVPMVIGTTGLSLDQFALMKDCSSSVSIFYSQNMSALMGLMNLFVSKLSSLLSASDYDAEILEIHHKKKKDAPSGTALLLGQTIASSRRQNFEEVAQFSRHCLSSPRKIGEIGFAVQRCGNAVGTHNVRFVGAQESISVQHESFSKEVFAIEAIRIAQWLVDKPAGLYNMSDYVRLNL